MRRLSSRLAVRPGGSGAAPVVVEEMLGSG
jgi:hypothetical protein